MSRPRPVVLIILDGFGERAEREDNAVRLAKTPELDSLFAKYPHGVIGTSGPDVGLPPGQMGNSEVGHLNFGAGRIAVMDIARIDNAVFDHSFGDVPVIASCIDDAKTRGGKLHLLGLVSDGGVHSMLTHLLALIDVAHSRGVPVVVHAFLDGRDVQPGTAPKYIATLQQHLVGKGVIGTVHGRYYAMDRDNRWDRVEKAYAAIVLAKGMRFPTAQSGIDASYAAQKTDEFVEPFVVGTYAGVDRVGDVALHFNFCLDRARELTRALTSETFDGFTRDGGAPFQHRYGCMTTYDASLGLPVAFMRQTFPDIFPEIIAKKGLRQFRCAETEKYAHVTYFFNGGREEPFANEDRKMIPSAKDVATYDMKPEMSAREVGEATAQAIESALYDFVLVNFANPDMVGHTGDLKAAITAVEATDAAVSRVVGAARSRGGAVFITADHGNCELMKDPATGKPHTSHTLNPVPLIYVNDADTKAIINPGGRICDVAPTMLAVMGLEKPAAMTGVILFASPR
ncbi:2,3-bisphosphoglycerate-independent phosphoglycerate mutase [soil metagenome]